MGHVAKMRENRCNVIDELEAAVTLKRGVRVWLEGGDHRTGFATDVYTSNGEDFLQLADHLPIPVSFITRVEKL